MSNIIPSATVVALILTKSYFLIHAGAVVKVITNLMQKMYIRIRIVNQGTRQFSVMIFAKEIFVIKGKKRKKGEIRTLDLKKWI